MIGSFPNLDPARLNMAQLLEYVQRLAYEVERLSAITVAPPLEIVRGATGYHLRTNAGEGFYAKITSGTNPYAWSEVQLLTNGTFSTFPGGRSGTTAVNPAYERNSIATVPANTIVTLAPGFLNYGSKGQELLFWHGGGTTGWTGTFTAVMVSDVSCSGSTLTVTKKTLTIVGSNGLITVAPTFA